MNLQKLRNYKYIVITLIAVTSSLLPVAGRATVSAHHAAECSDVFTPLSASVVNGANNNRTFYERAMNETGVPWEMLAAIHYRETNFSHTNPSNGQGIFQFSGGAGGPYPAGPVSDDEFYRQLKFMATRVQDDYVWRGSIPRERRRLQPNETNIVLVKDTLFSYNGRASVYANQASHFGYNSSLQPYEGSPYVMNRFDCPRARMGIITQDFGSMDGIDTRYGTFTIFARLRGDTYWRSLSASPFGDNFILAKSDDPNDLRQWVLYGGIKQYVPDSQTLFAWGLQNVPLVTTSVATLNSISTGPALDRLVRYNNGPIYFVDDGKKYKMPWDVLFDTWNLRGITISSVSPGLFNLPTDAGDLSFSIKNPSSSTVYMPEGANGSGQTILRPFANDTVRQAWEGTNRYTEVSADYWDRINDAIGSTLTSTKITQGGSEWEVSGTYKLSLNLGTSSLYPGTAQQVSAVTSNRLIPAGNASHLIRASNSPNVYLLDNGIRHNIASSSLFTAWTSGARVVEVNASFMNLITDGSPLNSYLADDGANTYLIVNGKKLPIPGSLVTAFENALASYSASTALLSNLPSGPSPTGFIKGANTPQVYLLDNSGNRRHLEWQDKVISWGGYETGITVLPDDLIDDISTAASPQIFVSDGTTNYLMDGGKKLEVSDSTKNAWGLTSFQTYGDDTLDRFQNGNSLQTNFRVGSAYFVVRDGVSHGTGDPKIAHAWGIENSQVYSQGVFNVLRNFMLTRYVRSNLPGDNRVFLVDKGQWYNLSVAHQNNLGVSGQPMATMNPSNAPNTITGWPGVVVKDGSNHFYVIDGGRKRVFMHQMIQDQWTNFGQISIPSVSEGFLESLPMAGHIERAIKGSSPSVYSAEAGTKRHILYPDTYHRYYSPYIDVSDALINALPTGPAIP